MPTQFFPLDHIHPNPWQTRLDDSPEHIADIASSLNVPTDLLQTPVGRAHPDKSGHVQIAIGHTRFAAFQLKLKQGNKAFAQFPVDLRPFTDIQMSDAAAIENAKRKDLSAIEKATAIQRRMKDFKLSQEEAAKPFGLSQSAASHLMALLKLPSKIQDHAHTGKLPERIARQLVPLYTAFGESPIVKLAEDLAKSTEENKDDELSSEIFRLLHSNKVTRLDQYRVYFPLTWRAAVPNTVTYNPPKEKDIPGWANRNIPSCTTCPFHLEYDKSHYCTRPSCKELKSKLFAQLEAHRLCKELGIPTTYGDGQVTTIVGNSYLWDEKRTPYAKLIKSKNTFLRLIPLTNPADQESCKALLGSPVVGLATTNLPETQKSLGIKPEKKSASNSNNDYAKQEALKRAKRELLTKQRDQLVQHIAPQFADLFTAFPPFMIDYLSENLAPWNQRTKFKKAGRHEQACILARSYLEEEVTNQFSDAPLAKDITAIDRFAKENKIKLPKNWHTPVTIPPAAASRKSELHSRRTPKKTTPKKSKRK